MADPELLRSLNISDLPNEILAHIFWLGTRTYYDEEEGEETVEQGPDKFAAFRDLTLPKPPTIDDFPKISDIDFPKDSSITVIDINTPGFSLGALIDQRAKESNKDEEEDWEDVDDEEGDPKEEPKPKLIFQVLVGQVCNHWRTVSIGTPLLWTFIVRSPLAKLEAFVSRSQKCPLDVELDFCDTSSDESDSDSPDDKENAGFNETLNVLCPHIARWRTFTVYVPEFALAHATMLRLNVPAPLLTNFGLYHYEEWDETNPNFEPAQFKEPLVLFQGSAPSLRAVVLWGVHCNWTHSPLRNLESLELSWHAQEVHPTLEDFAEIVDASPSLASLVLRHTRPRFPDPEPGSLAPLRWPSSSPDLFFPELEDLTVSHIEPDYLNQFIQHISVPSLTVLALDCINGEYDDFVRTLSRLSWCRSITILKLSSLACRTDLIKDLLLAMPNLTSLRINFNFVDAECIDFLIHDRGVPKITQPTSSPSMSPGFICPLLDTFICSGLDGTALLRFVTGRQRAPTKLKSLYIDERDNVDDDEDELLRDAVEKVEYFEPSSDEDEDDVDDDYDDEDGEDEDASA